MQNDTRPGTWKRWTRTILGGTPSPSAALAKAAQETGYFLGYRQAILHEWLVALTFLGIVLPPFFLIGDAFFLPPGLWTLFVAYHAAFFLLALAEFSYLRFYRPQRSLFVLGYAFSVQAALLVSLMSADLGGFASTQYVALILVMVATNSLMPWRALHTAANSALSVGIYLAVNFTVGPVAAGSLVGNLLCLAATAAVLTAISHARFRLIGREFHLLVDLRKEKYQTEARNESIKELLDVSGQGFLSFASNFLVNPEYSRECQDIFGGPIAGAHIDELLFPDEGFRDEFRADLKRYFSGEAEATLVFSRLGTRISVGKSNLVLQYRAMPGTQVLLILTDVTEELLLEEATRRKDRQRARLLRVISDRRPQADALVVARPLYLKWENYLKTECADTGLGKEMEDQRKTPLADLFRPFPALAADLADQLGKHLAPVTISARGLTVFPEDFRSLVEAMKIVVRNIVEREIEEPDQRIAVEKQFEGSVSIECRAVGSNLVFDLSDDGRGTGGSAPLGDLHHEVNKRGGRIDVHSVPGRGTVLTVTVPGTPS